MWAQVTNIWPKYTCWFRRYVISVWVGAVLHWFLTGWGAVGCVIHYVFFVPPVWLCPLGLLNWGKIAHRSHSIAISWWRCNERWPLRRCGIGVFVIIGITTTIFCDLIQQIFGDEEYQTDLLVAWRQECHSFCIQLDSHCICAESELGGQHHHQNETTRH